MRSMDYSDSADLILSQLGPLQSTQTQFNYSRPKGILKMPDLTNTIISKKLVK